jgi:23S rRNA pseudouridine1911/1915/1917 synthase
MTEPKIIFEDQDILIIEKPAGIIVNRADTTRNVETIQDWTERYLKIRSTKSEARNKSQIINYNDKNSFEFRNSDLEFAMRGGIVHRLDKETSGILLIAKNEESFVNLQKQFKEGRVHKNYIALCHGKITPSEGEINIPVGRLPWNRMRFGVLPQGREAKTRYRVISNFEFRISNLSSKKPERPETLSLVEVYPETGRTHQIRVHMQYIKHPIFADELYAGRKISRRDRKLLVRHFLHASKIKFSHPGTHEALAFESALPQDLSDFLKRLS